MNERNELHMALLEFISALYRDEKIDCDTYLEQSSNVGKLRTLSYSQGVEEGFAIGKGTYDMDATA